MRKIAIIGHEAAKFTKAGERQAKAAIRDILSGVGAQLVSGHCHLGGIDIWAEEVAAELMIGCHIFPPKNLTWDGGYKQRNLQIAECCDEAVCICVTRLADHYTGMRFPLCYHCKSKVYFFEPLEKEISVGEMQKIVDTNEKLVKDMKE